MRLLFFEKLSKLKEEMRKNFSDFQASLAMPMLRNKALF
jgi:hypothetical protein